MKCLRYDIEPSRCLLCIMGPKTIDGWIVTYLMSFSFAHSLIIFSALALAKPYAFLFSEAALHQSLLENTLPFSNSVERMAATEEV